MSMFFTTSTDDGTVQVKPPWLDHRTRTRFFQGEALRTYS
jgi:hypothetical protein